ncbi:hypothetical protein [Celeribacter marinus]|uniref:hypothetical protein n=1 Tax=Celeribacter marinus TaxID=1397108 RepID=UPI003174B933
MGKISSTRYALVLAGLIALLGGVGLAKGGLYIDRFEGDTAYMVDMVARMVMGQVPHVDFETPIGLMALVPVAVMAKAGFGIGQAFIAGQILVALILAPMVWRVGTSRLTGVTSWVFGVVCIALVLALVHGEDMLSVSVSMYYNRWAWVMAFVAILLAVVPPHDDHVNPRLDGVFIALALTGLAMSKPTYFVAFFVPIVLALVMRRAVSSLVFGVIAGALCAALIALFFGVGIFEAYIGDLLTVARSETRAAPGLPLAQIINGPQFLVATIVAILSVVVLRQSGQDRAGLLLMLLLPGFIYVTYQNFGNDPKWLILLAIYLLAHRPARGVRVLFNADGKSALNALALVSFALIMPSLQNIVTSPFRHLSENTQNYSVLMSDAPKFNDVFAFNERSNVVFARRILADEIPALDDYQAESKAREVTTFLGEALPRCALVSGDTAVDTYIADRLKQSPFNFAPETQFYMADVASMVWMIGGFAPLKGGAPWYYAGTPGLENADAIVVPLCAHSVQYRKAALSALEGAGLRVLAPIRDDLFLVYPIVRGD